MGLCECVMLINRAKRIVSDIKNDETGSFFQQKLIAGKSIVLDMSAPDRENGNYVNMNNNKVYNFQGSMFRPNELYYTETFNRNINTNPVTKSFNDQTGFAKFLYPNTTV